MKKKDGVVKWFSPEKGFGFISSPGTGDVYVHYTSILEKGFRYLTAGQKVSFELAADDRGPAADRVQVKH